MTVMQRFEGVRPVLCPAEAWFLIGQPAVNRTDLPPGGFPHVNFRSPVDPAAAAVIAFDGVDRVV